MAIETTVTPIADLEELFGLEVQCEIMIYNGSEYEPCAEPADYLVIKGCCGHERMVCEGCMGDLLGGVIECAECLVMSWPKMTRRI